MTGTVRKPLPPLENSKMQWGTSISQPVGDRKSAEWLTGDNRSVDYSRQQVKTALGIRFPSTFY